MACELPGGNEFRILSCDFVELAIAAHSHMVLDAVLTMRYFVLEVASGAAAASRGRR